VSGLHIAFCFISDVSNFKFVETKEKNTLASYVVIEISCIVCTEINVASVVCF